MCLPNRVLTEIVCLYCAQDNAEATLNDTDGDHGRSQIQDELEMYLQTKDAPKQTEILGW